jgi:uncharacterized NAD(P)/FAD-binding protein YdhS
MTVESRKVVIVGGGFSGAVLALKLARARPQDLIVLVERGRRVGVGLAYGACAPIHLLNVPVSRMELGLSPSFADWLQASGDDLSEALTESGGSLPDAFVPRAAFGRYLERQIAAALSADPERGLHRLRGEVVRVDAAPTRAVVLDDGRIFEADIVVLATGNMAPARPPFPGSHAVMESEAFVPDPWAPGVFDDLDPDAPVLLVGAGLTMVDIVLHLKALGHRGPMTAVSRHGWLPTRHASGGAWSPFLGREAPQTPLKALQSLRRQLALAAQSGVPWQRVFDAARPDAAKTWRGWDLAARRRFLRHLRTRWDMCRHRMSPRIADALKALLDEGRLTAMGGRIQALSHGPGGVIARIKLRHGGEAPLGPFARVINCTGPRSDFDRLETPLFAGLRARGLVRPDPLRLGLDTDRCALIDTQDRPSSWLYAIGPLTRPAHWEVTAVPEINAQVDSLVAQLLGDVASRPDVPAALDLAFADLGAGI